MQTVQFMYPRWNSALALASYLDQTPNISLYRDRNVLELGAGGALPSIVAAKNGAFRVVVTDYPDLQLIENIEYNVENNISGDTKTNVAVKVGHKRRSLQPRMKFTSISRDISGDNLLIPC